MWLLLPAHFFSSGLLDQWLIEGKFTEEEALSTSYDMLSAGIDTVMASDTSSVKF